MGSVETFVSRCVTALVSFRGSAISWPGPGEQRSIALAFEEEYGFPGCMDVVDGSLMPLASKPELFGENYFSRKCSYAINTLLVCDHKSVFVTCTLADPEALMTSAYLRTLNLASI